MLELLYKLARDCVGSSISTEMSLVTSVTVGALVMGMGNFSATVKQHFENANNTPALSMTQMEKEKALEENERLMRFEERQQKLEKERAARRRQSGSDPGQ